jgi:hypothetical protein
MRRFIRWLGGWEPLPELPPRSPHSFIFGVDDDDDPKRLRAADGDEGPDVRPRRSQSSKGGDPISRDRQ